MTTTQNPQNVSAPFAGFPFVNNWFSTPYSQIPGVPTGQVQPNQGVTNGTTGTAQTTTQNAANQVAPGVNIPFSFPFNTLPSFLNIHGQTVPTPFGFNPAAFNGFVPNTPFSTQGLFNQLQNQFITVPQTVQNTVPAFNTPLGLGINALQSLAGLPIGFGPLTQGFNPSPINPYNTIAQSPFQGFNPGFNPFNPSLLPNSLTGINGFNGLGFQSPVNLNGFANPVNTFPFSTPLHSLSNNTAIGGFNPLNALNPFNAALNNTSPIFGNPVQNIAPLNLLAGFNQPPFGFNPQSQPLNATPTPFFAPSANTPFGFNPVNAWPIPTNGLVNPLAQLSNISNNPWIAQFPFGFQQGIPQNAYYPAGVPFFVHGQPYQADNAQGIGLDINRDAA